jgi:PAS domain S-box-containing protein
MGARSERLSAFGDDFAWSLLDAAPDGIVIADVHGEVVFASRQAAALFATTAEDLVGRTVEDLVPEELRPAHRTQRGAYQSAPNVRAMGVGLLLTARRLDGSRFPVEISLSPMFMGGEAFTVAAVRDVTDRVEAEAELRRGRDALRDAEQVLALADDRERIARDLHDTVIQRLFGAGLQLQAVRGSTEPRVRDRLDTVIADLDETIKELRAAIFALQGSGPAPGGVRGRLFAVVSDAGPALGFDARLQFEGAVESIDPALAEDLVAVLREGLANVARHAHAGQVRVEVSVGDQVELCVSDDGDGVPDEVVGGRGLANLAARATQRGGRFEVARGPDGGTLLRWSAPAGPGRSTM